MSRSRVMQLEVEVREVFGRILQEGIRQGVFYLFSNSSRYLLDFLPDNV